MSRSAPTFAKAQALLAKLQSAPKQAAKEAKLALKTAPGDVHLNFAAGLIARANAKPRDARNHFVTSINSGNASAAAYVNAALCEAELGALDKALTVLAKGRARFAEDTELQDAEIRLLLAADKLDEAEAACSAALSRTPERDVLHVLAASIAEARADLAAALSHMQRAAPSVDRLLTLSRLQSFANLTQDALASAQKALKLAPDSADAHFSLGWRLLETGDFSAARNMFETCLEDETLAAEAFRVIAELSEPRDARMLEKRAEQLSSQVRTATDKGHIGLAKAEIAKHAGKPVGGLVAKANALISKDRRYDARADAAFHAAVLARYDTEDPRSASKPDLTARPIFITGMIRSGTTLLERLLSNAQGVTPLGEVALTDAYLRRVIAAEKPFDFESLRQRYSDQQALASLGGTTLDKMPFNYLYLGFLARAFPEAQLIVTQRDMRDVAVSAFESYFNTEPMNFSFREDWLKQKMDLVDAHVAAWQERGVPITRVQYEELVSDPEAVVADLARACDLPAVDLPSLATQPSAIRTASYAQARRPVNTRSIGRWKTYTDILPKICKP